MNGKKILCMILAPEIVISNAIAIQAHQPGHIIFLRTLYPGQISEEKPSHNRLFAWLESSEALLSEFKDLNEPFPIPYTPPKGYQKPSEQTPTYEVIILQKDEVREQLILLQQKYQDDDLHFDLFPGAKDIKVNLMIYDPIINWKMWYTTESGLSIHCEPNSTPETIEGQPLSLIDRGWLGGNPVLVERTFTSKPDKETMEFHQNILESLELEPPDTKKPTNLINRPKSVNHEGFKKKLEKLEYTVEITVPESSIGDTEARDMTISKGNHSISFCYINSAGDKAGFYLEYLIDIELWKSEWNPLETVLGLEVFEHSSFERKQKILRQFNNLKRHWIDVNLKGQKLRSESLEFEKICKRADVEPSKDLDENQLLSSELQLLRTSKIDVEELKRYTTVCELDVLMLDKQGIILFDGKVRTDGFKEDVFSTKRPFWLMHRHEFYVIPLSVPPKNFEGENILHYERLCQGRDVLINSDRCYPLPLSKEIESVRNFSLNDGILTTPGFESEMITTYKFEKQKGKNEYSVEKCHPSIRVNNKEDCSWLMLMQKLGHIPFSEKLLDFSNFSSFNVSYKDSTITIGKRPSMYDSGRNQFIISSKEWSYDDVICIKRELENLRNKREIPPDWPDWIKQIKILKIKDVRMIINQNNNDDSAEDIVNIPTCKTRKTKIKLNQENEKRIADSKKFEKNQRRRKPRGGRRGGSKTQPKRGNRGGKPKEE